MGLFYHTAPFLGIQKVQWKHADSLNFAESLFWHNADSMRLRVFQRRTLLILSIDMLRGVTTLPIWKKKDHVEIHVFILLGYWRVNSCNYWVDFNGWWLILFSLVAVLGVPQVSPLYTHLLLNYKVRFFFFSLPQSLDFCFRFYVLWTTEKSGMIRKRKLVT